MAGCIRSMASRVTVLDQKQKVDAAHRLQQRWQRWELSNYEYLMLVRLQRSWSLHGNSLLQIRAFWTRVS